MQTDFEPTPDGLPADDLLRRYEELQLRVTRFSAVEMQLVAARQREREAFIQRVFQVLEDYR